MSFRRPCLDCGELGEPGASRCVAHSASKERYRKQSRGKTPVANRAYRELRKLPCERCATCGLLFPPAYLNVDHIMALADGGGDSYGNIQFLCRDCHREKSKAEASARSYKGMQ